MKALAGIVLFALFLRVGHTATGELWNSVNEQVQRCEVLLQASVKMPRWLQKKIESDDGSLRFVPNNYLADGNDVRKAAVSAYVDDGLDQVVNRYLRNLPLVGKEREPIQLTKQLESAIKARVKELDGIISRSGSIPGNVILYRGSVRSKGAVSRLKVGSSFIDRGFVSTSLLPDVARKFAIEEFQASKYMQARFQSDLKESDVVEVESPDAVIIYKIRLPEHGTRGLYMPSYVPNRSSLSHGEEEFMLPRNSKFRVLKINKKVSEQFNVYVIEVQLL